MEGAMTVMRQLRDKMKMQVEQVPEQHHLQISKPMQNVGNHDQMLDFCIFSHTNFILKKFNTCYFNIKSIYL